MDLLLDAAAQLLRLEVLIALFAGAVGGVLIGAIPGVGPAVAIAILLPATFGFEPLVGLVLLLGIYGSSMFGGALPAILINVPGTAVNALTLLDGHPLAQRGEARRALSLACSASFIGGVFSVLCLMAFAPVLAVVAPLFGSRDIFMAALLGAVCVVVAHRKRTMAAAAMLCLGIFIHTIGFEPVRFSTRFTFDQDWLNRGFGLIVVVLGLFAIGQAYTLLLSTDRPSTPLAMGRGRLHGLGETLRHWRTAISSSTYGVVMGIIPGVGEFTAQFFAYGHAQRRSKHPEQFGHGAPEGLIAAESANNAVPAAAMVPLLALGIPGEALTAMMLSVFYVHGVIPGPALFQSQPEFLYSLGLALLGANIVALGMLISGAPLVAQVTRIPERGLGVAVLALALVGVYSLRNSLVDCIVAAAFGVLGYILRRIDWPIVPIILGMVLGRIMEEKLRAAMARVESPLDFVSRPISAIIFALILYVLFAHFRALRRQPDAAR